MENKVFLTTKQLAERWQLKQYTLENLRRIGKGIPFVKIGKSVRYSLEDIINYENENKYF